MERLKLQTGVGRLRFKLCTFTENGEHVPCPGGSSGSGFFDKFDDIPQSSVCVRARVDASTLTLVSGTFSAGTLHSSSTSHRVQSLPGRVS